MLVLPSAAFLIALTSSITWRSVRPGLERTEFLFARSGLLARVHVIALRIDPCRIRLSAMERLRDDGLRNAWTIDSIPADAVVALNGGQFKATTPFGWSVTDGVEESPPGTGPLTMAVTVDNGGVVRLLTPDEIPAYRGHVAQALQTYPTLLVDGALPRQLLPASHDIDLAHRDSRLAIGTTADGMVIVALTRFGGGTGVGSTLPYGPTIPELATLMRRLGTTRAVGLDGGLSSQLAVREANGRLTKWTNWRKVPVGIVGTATECTR
jgi:hypothetical protein